MDERAGRRAVAAGDAYRAVQHLILRVRVQEASDTHPEGIQRGGEALVLLGDDGAAHLQPALAQHPHQARVHAEIVKVVDTLRPAGRHDFVRGAHAVGPGNGLGLVIPHDEVQVVGIVFIGIQLVTRAFSHLAEGLLAEDGDLPHGVRNLLGAGGVDLQRTVIVLVAQSLRRQGLQLALDVLGGLLRGNGAQRGAVVPHMRKLDIRVTQQHAAQAHVGRHRFVIRQQGEGLLRNGPPDAQAVQGAAVALNLARQQRHAGGLVQARDPLEEPPRAAGDVHGHDLRLRLAGNGGDRLAPRVVDHAPVLRRIRGR